MRYDLEFYVYEYSREYYDKCRWANQVSESVMDKIKVSYRKYYLVELLHNVHVTSSTGGQEERKKGAQVKLVMDDVDRFIKMIQSWWLQRTACECVVDINVIYLTKSRKLIWTRYQTWHANRNARKTYIPFTRWLCHIHH